MNSPFAAMVPKDKQDNVAYRIWLLDKCRKSPETQWLVWEMCRQDVIFWIDSFVWTNDPRKKIPIDRVSPFICWDFQEALLGATPEEPYVLNVCGREIVIDKGIHWCKENKKSAVVEKSRDVGATWAFMIDEIHESLFFNHTKLLNISRSEEAVDDGTPDCLFWKLNHIVEHLPDWMVGPYEMHNSRLRLFRSKSMVTGVASTGKSGAGGRAGNIFVDEFQHIKEDVAVRANTANVADSVFFNGTHDGTTTEFYRLTKDVDIIKIQIHWTQHPEKSPGLYRSGPNIKPSDGPNCHNGYEILDVDYEYPVDFKFNKTGLPNGGPFPHIRSPWYDWKSSQIGNKRGIAMNLDIDPEGTSSQFFDLVDVEKYIGQYCQDPLWEGDLSYDSETVRPLALVPRSGGNLKLWINPKSGGKPEEGTFVVSTDPSWGTGATPSCITIANATTGEKVGEFTDAHIRPIPLARLCVALCWLFKDSSGVGAKLVWEIQGPGTAFGPEVMRLGYRNLYERRSETSKGSSFERSGYGWSSTGGGKKAILEAYRMAMWDGKFVNRSEAALKECLHFVHNGTDVVHTQYAAKNVDPSQARENHADHVIADALAWKLIAEVGKLVVGPDKRAPEPLLSPNTLAGRWRLRDNLRRQATKWS